MLGALKSNSLLNESTGAGHLERRWAEAFKSRRMAKQESAEAFLDASMERLINPDEYLERKIPEWVAHGDFGLVVLRSTGRRLSASVVQ